MAMGIVSDKDFDAEITKVIQHETPQTPVTDGVIKDVSKGRGKGNIEVPNTLRNIIGEESAINGRQSALELAKSFGISASSVSAYDVGATSTSSYGNRPNLPIINEAKERVAKRARTKLMRALHHITNDKLEGTNARDLAGIAKDMSAIVRNMEPDSPQIQNDGNKGPTFVFYSPQFRKEEHFDIVNAKD